MSHKKIVIKLIEGKLHNLDDICIEDVENIDEAISNMKKQIHKEYENDLYTDLAIEQAMLVIHYYKDTLIRKVLKQEKVCDSDISEFYYCGEYSVEFNTLEFFTQETGLIKFPHFKSTCICGHTLKTTNCYIFNGKHVIIVGSCCIKKFKKMDINGNLRNFKTSICKKCDREPLYKKGAKSCLHCSITKNRNVILEIEPKSIEDEIKKHIDFYDDFILLFGKYSGKEYKEIYEKDKGYCDFVRINGKNKELILFNLYVKIKDFS